MVVVDIARRVDSQVWVGLVLTNAPNIDEIPVNEGGCCLSPCPCSLQRFGLFPHADVGGYLFVHCNVAAFTFNYAGWIFLVQCNGCTRSDAKAVYFMKLLVTFAIDIGNSCGLAHL